MKRIPFDSLCLAAVLSELQASVGSFVRRVIPISFNEVGLHLVSRESEWWLLLSADAVFARIHLVMVRPPKGNASGDFVRTLRSRLEGLRFDSAEQIGSDRIANLRFSGREGTLVLVAELMGKHSNLILTDEGGRIVACLKSIGSSKSKRPVLVGRWYELPPIEINRGSDAPDFIAASPFLSGLTKSDQRVEAAVRRALAGDLSPVRVPGFGAYPVSVSGAGYEEMRTARFSEAIEQELSAIQAGVQLDQAKRTLAGQLERVLLAREAAMHDLQLAADTAARARELQICGELVLAFASQIEVGASQFQTQDYDGRTVTIELRTDLTPQENAQRYFDKAKRAKLGAAEVHERMRAISSDAAELRYTMHQLVEAGDMARVQTLVEFAASRKWLNKVTAHEDSRVSEKPAFDGHRVRVIDGPRGFKVLYGENATSNDYLTSRIAKPNDYWLHVRGATSAHVVIQTGNQPNRVGPDVLRFAAEIAHKNSTAKHSKHVAVDYTLKKYVRKPRGSAVGAAVYTHEKTIYVGE